MRGVIKRDSKVEWEVTEHGSSWKEGRRRKETEKVDGEFSKAKANYLKAFGSP